METTKLPIDIALRTVLSDDDSALKARLQVLGQSLQVFQKDEVLYFLTDDGHSVRRFPDKYAKGMGAQLLTGFVRLVDSDGRYMQRTPRHTIALGEAVLSVLGRYPDTWPTLDSCVHGPVFQPNDNNKLVRKSEGYERGQLILAPQLPAFLPPVIPGYPHLHKLFSGLLFAREVYRGNLLGYAVAMFCRTGIESFPILLLDSNQKSSGKTVTAQALALLMTGNESEASPITFTGRELEFEQRLGSFAGRPGPNPIVIDNIHLFGKNSYGIRSQAMSTAVHHHSSRCRQLYKGPVPLFDPLFICTMNGALVEDDLSDKALIISVDRPPGAASFREIEPWPLDYVRQHRMDLLAEVYQILERITLDDHHTGHTRFFSFEQIVLGAARELGLEASFDPKQVRSPNIVIRELISVLASFEYARTLGIQPLTNRIRAEPGCRQLNEILSTFSCAQYKVPFEFAKWLLVKVHEKTFDHEDGSFRFSVDIDGMKLYTHR